MKITSHGFAVLDDDKDTHLSRWCERDGRLDQDGAIAERYVPLIPEGGNVVDAGAALGDHTCAYSRRVGPTGTVWAFEPNSLMYECLEYNCRIYPNAVPVALGLGSKFGMFSVQQNENAGASWLLKEGSSGDRAFVVPLDIFRIQKLDFMKMDIEGMEYDALLGAKETISRCRPVIVLECNPPMLERSGSSAEAVKKFLTELGYSVSVFMGNEDPVQLCELIARP